jgi:Pectate lyase superfamily protein
MPKSIPTIGDSNWGTPLNNHLSQLQNPTNGGINSFEQFSGRPTTLTLDDIGKTYIYTQTGNLHQWTGTTWKVLNESFINVKDYGAVGDGVTDDTAAIQGCISNYNIKQSGRGEMYFPDGVYKVGELFFRHSEGFGPNNDLWSVIKGSGNVIFTPNFNNPNKYILNFLGIIGNTSVGQDRIHNVKLCGFKIEGENQKCSGISFTRVFGFDMENINVNRCNIGIYITATSEGFTKKIGGILNNTHIICDGAINSEIGTDNDCGSMTWVDGFWAFNLGSAGFIFNYVGPLNIQGGTYGINYNRANATSLFKITDNPGNVSRGGDNREISFQNLVIEVGGTSDNGVDSIFDITATSVPTQIYIKNVLNGAPSNKYFIKSRGASSYACVNINIEGYQSYTSAGAPTDIGEFTNITIGSMNFQKDLASSLLILSLSHPSTSSLNILNLNSIYYVDTQKIVTNPSLYGPILPGCFNRSAELEYDGTKQSILLSNTTAINKVYRFDQLANYIISFQDIYISGMVAIYYWSDSTPSNFCHFKPFGSFVGSGIQNTGGKWKWMYIPFQGKAADFDLTMEWGLGSITYIKKINILFDKIPYDQNLSSYYDVDLTGATLYIPTVQGEMISSKDGIYKYSNSIWSKI